MTRDEQRFELVKEWGAARLSVCGIGYERTTFIRDCVEWADATLAALSPVAEQGGERERAAAETSTNVILAELAAARAEAKALRERIEECYGLAGVLLDHYPKSTIANALRKLLDHPGGTDDQ